MDPASTLRRARRSAGLTQRALAARVGVAQPSVARIESGAVIPRVDTLDRLLSACGVRLSVAVAARPSLDTSAIDAILRLSPTERVRLAALEAGNVARLLEGRWR